MRKSILTAALSLLIVVSAKSQEKNSECKVLMEKISGSYEGGCKKGLAHGHGVAKGEDTYTGNFRKGLPDGRGLYTYSNGDSYFGLWRNGKKHGQGIIRYQNSKKDSIVKGTWVNDYMVQSDAKPQGYRVGFSRSIDQYSIVKTGTEEYRVEITFERAMSKYLPSDLSITGSSGNRALSPSKIIFVDINYPFTCTIEYTIKYMQNILPCNFIFTISEPGKWDVKLIHN
ncbi:MAG: hypothetical protein P1P88_19550 [Bacteroidales bacterium]|nr:hypothetical protein [Bacteroidales bacterium]